MNGTQIEQVKNEVMPISDQALVIRVIDQPTLTKANDFFLVIRQMRKKIGDVFDPIIEAAKEAKKKADNARAIAIREKEKIEEPLLRAEAFLNGQIVEYKREQDRKRQEEEEILRQEAIKNEMERRKKEEEDRLAQAAELEKVGAQEEAGMLLADTIEEIAKPIEVYIPPPETPKVELEGATVKTFWKAEVIDLRALVKAILEGKAPLNAVEANMTMLNGMARSLKKEMNIPGVKAVSTSSMAATGRR